MAVFHRPVLLDEVVRYLNIKKGKKYIDATVGGGGHAAAICKLGGKILGIDLDPEAIEAARKRLLQACPSPEVSGDDAPWRLADGNYADLKKIAAAFGFDGVDGILLDLGVSSHQLETPRRGFSFRHEGPLDMRMSPKFGVRAADLLNALSERELNELFFKLGEEKHSRRYASDVVRARRVKPFEKTSDLTALFPPGKGGGRLHPATRVFQALRIAVNDELQHLKTVLPQALELLSVRGRLLVISFHSGEDRIVKNFFKNEARRGRLKLMTKKPIRPAEKELIENPRSRSAKLRVAERTEKE